MVALNGTHLSGSLNGTPVGERWLAPSTSPEFGAVTPPSEKASVYDQHDDVAQDQPPPSTVAPADQESDPSPDQHEAERTRLETEISAAKARATAAKERAVARDLEVRAALHAEVVASRESLAEMEREYEVAIASVRTTGQAEVERILAEARQLPARHTDIVSPEESGVIDAD